MPLLILLFSLLFLLPLVFLSLAFAGVVTPPVYDVLMQSASSVTYRPLTMALDHIIATVTSELWHEEHCGVPVYSKEYTFSISFPYRLLKKPVYHMKQCKVPCIYDDVNGYKRVTSNLIIVLIRPA
jgi:hypothetical protein